MDSFCGQCGSRISQGDAFCPQCGAAAVQPVVQAAPLPAGSKRRWPYWLIVVVAAFIAGLWWGQHHVRQLSCAAAASGLGGGGGGGGRGGGGKLAGSGGPGAGHVGSGSGDGTPLGGATAQAGDGASGTLAAGGGGGSGDVPDLGGGGPPVIVADGSGRPGNPGSQTNGDLADPGGGGGKKPLGDGIDPDGAAGNPGVQDGADILRRLAAGQMRAGEFDDKDGAPDPTAKTLTARDFTYDRTGLPRYATAVRGVVSVMTVRSDGPEGYASSVGIVTDSSFTDVVEWYRKHVPAGWHNETIGDFQALANSLSPQAIANALGAGNAAHSSAPSPAPAPRMQISMIMPPPGTPDQPGVMIVAQDGHAVTVLMKAHRGP
jgi:hypothetical protein